MEKETLNEVKGYYGIQDHMMNRLRSGELEFHQQILKELGLIQTEDKSKFNFQISLFLTPKEWKELKHGKKMPGQRHLCMKDNLHISLSERQKQFKEEYSFWTEGYVLPKEWKQFKERFESKENKDYFILKPFNSSCGNKIRIATNIEKVSFEWCKIEKPLAQKYIINPLLINGYKFTLRIYCIVCSIDPLRIYIFENGLVRIASRKYSTEISSFDDNFIHLDSIDINYKNEKEFIDNQDDKEVNNEGLRCEVKWLLNYLKHKNGIDSLKIWNEIEKIVVKSILSAEKNMTESFQKFVPSKKSSFVYFGFDVLIDNESKIYILEINNTPSLKPKTEMENKIKYSMLKSSYLLVDVVGERKNKVDKIADEIFNLILNLSEKNKIKLDQKFELISFSKIKKDELWSLVDFEFEFKDKNEFKLIFPLFNSDFEFKDLYLNNFNSLHISWQKLQQQNNNNLISILRNIPSSL